jgi:hypothetical protein
VVAEDTVGGISSALHKKLLKIVLRRITNENAARRTSPAAQRQTAPNCRLSRSSDSAP